jgi:hypothetical protein
MGGESLLKRIGGFGFGLVVMVGVLGIGLLLLWLFVGGMVWASAKLLPWLDAAGQIAFDICILVFLPLCIFRKTRVWAGMGFYIASFVFGTFLAAFSCVVAFQIWGFVGLVFGLIFFGVGVVPVAFLATLFHSEWHLFWEIVIGIILTFGSRALGMYLSTPKKPKAMEEAQEEVVVLRNETE